MARAQASKRRTPAAPKPEENYLRLDDQLCFPLYLASRLVVNAYRPMLEALDLTYPQYLVLLVLWEKDGLSVGAIGERLHLDSGTLTPLLKRLEKQGLIERRRQALDDRVVESFLTRDGKALRARANQVPVDLLCKANLTMDDVQRMKAMLDELIEHVLPLQSA
jgi:DNA-binding MarR family transcriptional regulator